MSNAINVRVVSPIITKGFRKDSDFDTIRNLDLNISHSQIEIGPASIETEFDEAMCQPDTILKIIDAENEGCDAAVIDCMGDPGLKGARECVSIPVVGPCETAMHYASMLGHKFTVLTVLERTKPLIENLSKIYGVSSKLASATSVDIPVLELEKDLNYTLKQMTNKAIQTIEKDNADVIIFGCTGMLGCADTIENNLKEKGYNVPVIDPIPLAVNSAYVLAKLKLSQSKKCYPYPPEKGMVGFEKPKLKAVN
jgi:allantoin racemase